ncbi:branched-chain amino acid ABC transporter substrate-binding protein [Oceanidesulfovibrio indonesiensis]|uniref:Branched-chain amino acid ABC transporter substrate-binding protein n=1 Tax=Oceanidesulfovibrio indonesiensis TaxID=54767 RepID=A0A7M3MKK0_9BACT|nr:ABC transporter substrate-binding protein [Oceanidesulfovibrio indonesiensis]TVM19922.1 branched-chain amino acid ABC transporter substrate-binding protein [Oceanidesulfovibrio indonesiensis]
MKKIVQILVAAAMTLLLAGPAMAEEPIKIAVPSPFSGGAAAYGDNVKAGVAMKIAEVNEAGGIDGRMIEAVYLDEMCEPKEAATVASKIAQDDSIIGGVGHLCSSAHLAALPTYVRKGIPMISPTATNVTISEKNKDRDGRVWSFRDVYRDDYQGKFLARYVSEVLGLKKIAIFYENNDYGIGLKDAFSGEAGNVGLEVVGSEGYMKGTTDFTPQLTSLKSDNPDGLFISGYYNEGALIANQAKKLGMDVIKFGADGLDNVDYINLAKDAADGTYMTVPFLADAAGEDAQVFIAKFKEETGRDVDWMSANAYDAAGMLIAAIREVGADRAKVQEYLAAMTTPEKGYQGVTGLTYFDEHGDAQKAAYVKMVKDGEFIPAPEQLN